MAPMSQIPDSMWGEFITWFAKVVAGAVAIWKGIWPALKWAWNWRKRRREARKRLEKDVTEIKNMAHVMLAQMEVFRDNQIAQGEMKLQHLDISDKMVVMLSQLGELEFANEAFLKFVDKDLPDLEHSNWISSIVHQEDRQAVREYLKDCVNNKRRFKYEFRLNLNGHGVHLVEFEGKSGEKAGYFINVKQKQ